MRQDFFEYRPTFKLFTAGNHKPSLRSVDEAIGALSPSGSHSSRSCRLASPIRFRSHPGPFFPSGAEVRFLALLRPFIGPIWNGGKGSISLKNHEL